MSVVAEFSIRSERLTLASALASVPEVELEMVQEVGTDPDQPYMFIWARAADIEAWETALAADPTATEVERYTEIDGEALYRIRISPETEVVAYPLWVDLGVDQLSVRWSDGWWHVRSRFPSRDAITAVQEWAEDNDVQLELERMYAENPEDPPEGPVTPEQREVLLVALELGYFDVPRNASMADVAAELDISSQAVSERLRRGHQRLIRSSLR